MENLAAVARVIQALPIPEAAALAVVALLHLTQAVVPVVPV
jgi:hypothetical protein